MAHVTLVVSGGSSDGMRISLSIIILGALTNLRKATIGLFLSVCPHRTAVLPFCTGFNEI
jgi:hypothetical protein